MATSAPDPHIIRLRPKRVPSRPATLSQLVDALYDRVRALECAHDLRAGFAAAYADHSELVEAMRRAGVFGVGAVWLERLMLEQAGQYFRALDAWDAGDLAMTPAPWRAVFARARYEADLPEDELARLSAVVHTAYDLPLAFARCPFEAVGAADARRAFDRLPALAIIEHASPLRSLPWRRRPITSDVSLRPQAWDDGMCLLDATSGDDLREAFTRLETRVLLRVAG
jgi:hypothetical protein